MLAFLLALFFIQLVSAEWMSEIPHAPSRWYSKLLGLPTWIAEIQDYNDDAFNATTIFSVLTIFVSTLYAIYYIFWVYYPGLPRNRRSIGPFNTLILLYLVATFFATLSFSIMNAGRIWASFGVYHNLFEIAWMLQIVFRYRSLKEPRFVLFCFVYVLATMFIVIVLPWPLDALFFKFQGLATDFALSIDLGRLYYHNKGIYKKSSVGTMVCSEDDDCESNDEYNKECDQLIKPLSTHQQSQQHERQESEDTNKKSKYRIMTPAHTNIGVIFAAALLHGCGNALVTFSNHFVFWVIFQFIYAIAYPMYAYYLVAEPNASRVAMYRVDYAKEVLVMLSGITLSGLCIAVGIYNAGIHH